MSARKKASTKVAHVEKSVLHRFFLCRMLFVFVLQDGQISGMMVGKGDFEEREDVGNGWDRYLLSVGREMLVRGKDFDGQGLCVVGGIHIRECVVELYAS